jgi:tRNA nucleotidyltransferase (CCA-adding enzyme)
VGGAVRDELLGLAVQDRDWVVVGSTPEEMVSLGFRPVGKDFPVFIHPRNGEEYALARTERKTAKGYHGFSFHAAADVTLEADLSRRDLTINAIAKAPDGSLIDPYGGVRDLEIKTFRHVSMAFKEDPVRILRVARFAARFADFEVHPSTNELMRLMVQEGEVAELVAERVWQELARGLMENKPSRMLLVLQNCGALSPLIAQMTDETLHTMCVQVDLAAQQHLSLPERFALMAQWIEPQKLEALRLPTDAFDLATLLRNIGDVLDSQSDKSAADYANLLHRCDVLRRPERFAALLRILCIAKAMFATKQAKWQALAKAYQSTNAGEIAASISSKNGLEIQHAVTQARIKAVEFALEQSSNTPRYK